MEQIKIVVLSGCAVGLTLLMLVTLVRAVLGPRFTDRVVAVNVINTLVVAVVAILAAAMGKDYLVDIALIYGLLSFLAVVVLSHLVDGRRKRRERKEEQDAL